MKKLVRNTIERPTMTGYPILEDVIAFLLGGVIVMRGIIVDRIG